MRKIALKNITNNTLIIDKRYIGPNSQFSLTEEQFATADAQHYLHEKMIIQTDIEKSTIENSIPENQLPFVLVAVPIKNSAKHLPDFLTTLSGMDYPHDKLRFVFVYGESTDNTLDIIKSAFKKTDLQYEIHDDPPYENPTGNSLYIAESMNVLSAQLKDEQFVLFLDSDIISIPPNTLKELIKIDRDIVAPIPKYKHRNRLLFYDYYGFRIGGKTTEHLQLNSDHEFFKNKEPVEMSSVGTFVLVKSEVVKNVKWNNPFPWLRFNQDARKKSYRVWAAPYLTIIHANCLGETTHMPLEYYVKNGRVPVSELNKIREPSVEISEETKYPQFTAGKTRKSLKILLHAPLHPSYWIYLMETMPEHEWFIEPREDFEEGMTPRKHIKYTVVPRNSKIKFDAQIFLLHAWSKQEFYKLLKDFPVPPVFIEVWKFPIPSLKVKYPLISGCKYFSDTQYPNIQYSYVPPSKTLWEQKWIGDIPKVFFPAQRYLSPEYSHSKLARIMPLLKRANLDLDIVKTKTRVIPFNEWRDKFIHNRVLLDCSEKYASFVVEEAMAVGMPIVTLGRNESSLMVRDKIDGFSKWTDNELIKLLRKFTKNKEFANEWSIKSMARGNDILDPNKTRNVFNQAIEDAIVLFNSSQDPLCMENPEHKVEKKLSKKNRAKPVDFTFIFWEMKNRDKNPNWGYPCRGYPQADKLVPAFKRVGANLQSIEFCDYANVNMGPETDQKDPFKTMEPIIQSDNILFEWDGITIRRDYKNLLGWKKNLFIIPHHEGRMAGYKSSRKEEVELRRELIKSSTKVIFELQTLRDDWKELECDKFELLHPPTRIGTQFDKMEARKVLGIRTEYAIICWGQYTEKGYENIFPWIAEWEDTSLLFCGSGTVKGKQLLKNRTQTFQIEDRVFFSKHKISDEDADLWFSASDLCTCPRNYFGTATPIYVVGQGKVCILPSQPPPHVILDRTLDSRCWNGYKELEQISGIVTSTDLKRTTRELLLNKKKRKALELKSIKYAQNNSFENYAIRIGKMMGYSYSVG